MKCVFCKHGETKPGKATTTMEREGCVMVVKNVPAQICDNCGEEYFDAPVTESLLKLTDEACEAGVLITVRNYAA